MSIYNVPHYPNDADYTTNAASYYDDLARKNELMKHLAMRIWEYDKELAKRFAQWDQNLEDFPEDVKNLLLKWLQDGTLETIINENIFADLNGQIRELAESLKALDLKKAKSSYVFDLNLAKRTVNQGIAIDEVNQHIYASQAYVMPGDTVESFYITRMTMGGKLLDTMMVRHGGHAASFGIERENGQVFIWSNMIKSNTAGGIGTQWLARFPYAAGSEVNVDSSTVTKYKEFPDANYYHSPVCDNKNGLIALRVTSTRTGNDSHMELYKLADVKNRSFLKQGTFNFTNNMNQSPLQGIAIDGDSAYLSFGMSVNEYMLYHGDMKTDTLVATYTAEDLQIQASPQSYEFNMSEPEGLYVYTDPKSKQKTLLQVFVTSAPNRRRNRVYAISSNEGYLNFVGNGMEFAQMHPLTLNNGQGIPLHPSHTRLDELLKTGEYYLTLDDTNRLLDFPLPGVAGWWLTVSAGDTGGGVLQTLRRNSSVHSTVYRRIVTGEGVTTAWDGLPIRPTFENGYSDFYPDEPAQKFMFTRTDNTLHLMGIIKPPEVLDLEKRLFVLPSGYRPIVRQAFLVNTSNGIMECMVETDGEVRLPVYKTEGRNPTYVHLNCTVGLNGLA